MKNYESYRVEDFIDDKDFEDWVRGRSSREAFWRSFLQHYPDRREAFHQAEQFIRAATVAPERISEAEIRKEVERFIEATGSAVPNQSTFLSIFRSESSPRLTYGFRWAAGIAALLLAVVGLGWYSIHTNSTPLITRRADGPNHSPDGSVNQFVETFNNTKQLLRVVLSDSSEVLLSPKSRLRYPSQFVGNVRKVYLAGEGSFSVKRRKQPFMVYSGETVTKVLGTRFVVSAFDLDKKITVQVLSGKVSVYKANPERASHNKEVNGLILNANQAAIFEKSDGNLTKTLVANPTLIRKNTKVITFVYDDVALSMILRELETSYGIPIQFDEQSFEGCKITAALSSESLYEKLDLLCKAASATYEIIDGQIVLSRKSYR
jgi:transmembrane sensor